jgi:para-aminobenzoate synthetase component 1
MLNWVNQFNIFCFLDNHQYNFSPHKYECLIGAGVSDFISTNRIEDIDVFLSRSKEMVFGHLNYDVKNVIYNLKQAKSNEIDFPLYYFFRPKIVLMLKGDELTIIANDPNEIFNAIMQSHSEEVYSNSYLQIQQKLTRQKYIQIIKKLQEHIVRGDCYEINFCQEFYSENANIDPLSVYKGLTQLSPNPFSAFYRLNDKYLLCASPERFIQKIDNVLLSQPMKGTIKRDLLNDENDKLLEEKLKNSTKDRSENVMVVDLVRNDLSRVCSVASVHVDQLFEVYSFPQVHQMVSTISGKLKDTVPFSKIIASLFPMGSMTGAPKLRVMELIDEYESGSRGLFSGSVGYIDPQNGFDFNVVIRSILYNASSRYLSYFLGSGITFYSEPEKEWEECMLKGEAIKKVLTLN